MGGCSKISRTWSGFTLVELVLVILVLGLLTSMAVVRIGTLRERSQTRIAESELATLREALLGTSSTPGYLPDMERVPGFTPVALRVHNLLTPTNVWVATASGLQRLDAFAPAAPPTGCAPFNIFTNWNAESERGWRGPYLRVSRFVPNRNLAHVGLYPAPDDQRHKDDTTFAQRGFYPPLTPNFIGYGTLGELAVADPWGNPYILQIPPPEVFNVPSAKQRMRFARLVSAGPDGTLQTPCFPATSAPAWTERLLCRLAGRTQTGATAARGDDLVLFVNRPDIYEESE